MCDLFPRWLIIGLIVVSVVNLGAIYSRPPQHDTQFATMVRLLEWHDSVFGATTLPRTC